MIAPSSLDIAHYGCKSFVQAVCGRQKGGALGPGAFVAYCLLQVRPQRPQLAIKSAQVVAYVFGCGAVGRRFGLDLGDVLDSLRDLFTVAGDDRPHRFVCVIARNRSACAGALVVATFSRLAVASEIPQPTAAAHCSDDSGDNASH